MIDTEHDQLPPRIQRTLKLYDISPAEWDALRTAPNHTQLGGRTFLTPDAAERSTATMSDHDRDMLSLKLGTLYSDIADRAIITPTASDRQIMLQGTLRGTPVGEAARFFSQFKLWSVAAVRQGLGREVQGQGASSAIWGMLQLATAGTLTGLGIASLKALVQGKTPPDLHKLSSWFEGAAQGGGLGILADFLFKGDNRFGQNAAETLAGPVMGSGISAVMKLYDAVRDGEKGKNIASDALKIGTDNTPFINLFYTRSLLNYLLLYSLHETINPGSLQRSQRALQRSTGQTYYNAPAPLPGYFSNPANHLRTLGH